MMTSVSGMRILVTRPQPQNGALCAYINARGGIAIALPTICFTPPKDIEAVKTSLKKINDQDWLIFMSPQAVKAALQFFHNYGVILEDYVKIAAIGEGTAFALAEQVPATSAGQSFKIAAVPSIWNSEGLLSLPDFELVMGQQIMLIRGEGGRDYLEKILKSRGANVLNCIVYQRTLPILPLEPYKKLIKNQQIHRIVSASFESIHNLKRLFDDDDWQYLKTVPLIVVSDRIKMLAQQLGFQTIWVAANAHHEAIVNACIAHDLKRAAANANAHDPV